MITTGVSLRQASAGYVGHPDVVVLGEAPEGTELIAHARLLAGRIDTRALVEEDSAFSGIADAGQTFVFRYGAVVSIMAEGGSTRAIDAALAPWLRDAEAEPEVDSAEIRIARQATDRIGGNGQILLADSGEARLTLVAIVLARSEVMSRDEVLVSQAFDHIAPLVDGLRQTGRTRFPIRQAMRLVGEVLAARHRVMASVQADERPDVLWDNPELDRLYARLEAEYEIDDRAEVLERKFVALGDFAEVLLDIIQDKRAFRLELAIIVLITFEIVLALVNMHWR
jgi:uncharacterized Rmd1/YagE family protein